MEEIKENSAKAIDKHMKLLTAWVLLHLHLSQSTNARHRKCYIWSNNFLIFLLFSCNTYTLYIYFVCYLFGKEHLPTNHLTSYRENTNSVMMWMPDFYSLHFHFLTWPFIFWIWSNTCTAQIKQCLVYVCKYFHCVYSEVN